MNIQTAYFSMEIGVKDSMKTYAGGLGILAGDTIKTAADTGYGMVAVTLLYKNGYFKQNLASDGEQLEAPDTWDYQSELQDTGVYVDVPVKDGIVKVQVLKHTQKGLSGEVDIIFLNTDLEDNPEKYKYASYNLYTPFENTRLLQEIILGIGGVYALQALGYTELSTYHLNESHAAFGILALEETLGSREEAKSKVVFTTHTPAEHGHKKYHFDELSNTLTQDFLSKISDEIENGIINMTIFCLNNSRYSNAVAKRHGEVSNQMFPGRRIDYITNGIHIDSWISDSFRNLFNEEIGDFLSNPNLLKKATKIKPEKIAQAHLENKKNLIQFIKEATQIELSVDVLTIGFARRVDGYKRSGLIFKNLPLLKRIAEQNRGLQLVFSGKAYFDYKDGEDYIGKVFQLEHQDLGKLRVVYIPDYGMSISKYMISGCDLWLNNPLKPLEASGTSGMKAALNGVPNFSTLDGWWLEGYFEGKNGWSIGDDSMQNNEEIQIYDLYSKLEHQILPIYNNFKRNWYKVARNAIALNASYFNTHRMLEEYRKKAYELVE